MLKVNLFRLYLPLLCGRPGFLPVRVQMVRHDGLEQNYPQLQNLIKRDPGGYEEDYRQQFEHFCSMWTVLGPGSAQVPPHLEALLLFISHCAQFYRALTGERLPELLLGCLEDVDRMSGMEPTLRRAIVQAALLLKRDKLMTLERVLPVLFRLLRLQDKPLRQQLTQAIVQSLKSANTPHLNVQLSKAMLTFLESELIKSAVDGLDEGGAAAALYSLDIIVSLYKKGIWTDARTVNIVASAALQDRNLKVMLLALNFLLGSDSANTDLDPEPDSDDGMRAEAADIKGAYAKMRIAGKTKGRKAKIERMVKQSKRKRTQSTVCKFPAIELIYDPERYAERLLVVLKKTQAPFEAKLTLMNVLSRIIAVKSLVIPDYYPVLLRYLQPHQRQVTRILAFCAQAAHSGLPSDLIAIPIKAIANNFVAEHAQAPVIAAGLNAIRECCARCPTAMDAGLLHELTEYKTFKDKSVMMAARSLIGLFRDAHPELLNKKDRGRPEKRARSIAAPAPDVAAESDSSESCSAAPVSEGDSSPQDTDDGSSEASGSGSDQEEEADLLEESKLRMLSTEEMTSLRERHMATADRSKDIVNPDDIGSVSAAKTGRLSKSERLARVKAGRDPERKFGAAGKTAEHRASGKSRSNKVKRRGKLFSMLKRSRSGVYGGKKQKVKKRRHA